MYRYLNWPPGAIKLRQLTFDFSLTLTKEIYSRKLRLRSKVSLA